MAQELKERTQLMKFKNFWILGCKIFFPTNFHYKF